VNYTKLNREAWEEVFPKHKIGWKVDLAEKLLKKDFFFLDKNIITELERINLSKKTVGQFCCNNGRELLSIVKLGAESGIGFDIAGNFIDEANRIAKTTKLSCQFIATDIYELSPEYNGRFDLMFLSIGTLCWFPDLSLFFQKVSNVLKENGTLFINESHPFTNTLASTDDEEYDKNHPEKFAFSYFKDEPWVTTKGLDYIGGTRYQSKPAYSFSHTFSEIINSMAKNGIFVRELKEYDYDIGAGFQDLDHHKIPLSYILIGKKNALILSNESLPRSGC
jgi:SAM-dependent methyltransferase